MILFGTTFLLTAHIILANIGTLEGKHAFVIALIESSNLLGIDDAFRFHLSRYAFSGIEIYSWDYVLPISTSIFGLIVSITEDSIFISRMIIIFISFTGYALLYLAIKKAEIRTKHTIPALLILILMPVQIAMSMSFYGESLLVFCMSLTAYLFLSRRYTASAITASLLPLIRPEGIFLLAPISVYFILKKRTRDFIITGAAGFIFLIFLITYFSGEISLLTDWRLEVRKVWKTFLMPNSQMLTGPISTYNIFWVIPGIYGCTLTPVRKYWPIWLGAYLWAAFYMYLVQADMASYESRYLCAAFPATTLGFAAFLNYGLERIKSRLSLYGDSIFYIGAGLTVFILAEHFLQLDPIRAPLTGGNRLPIPGMQVMNQGFYRYTETEMDNLRRAAKKIESLSTTFKEIDSIIVYDYVIFYFLTRKTISTGVQIELAPVSQPISNIATGGSIFSYSQNDRRFNYYNFSDPREPSQGLAIYVGPLESDFLLPEYTYGNHSIYVVGYQRNNSPNFLFQGKMSFFPDKEWKTTND